MGNLVYSASLHNHTDYSNFRLRDSINRVEELIDYAIELGHKGIAFTEHETISNAIHIERYWDKIKEQHPDFKIIRGNEIYLCRNGLTAENFDKENDKYWHFILLAKDAIGHEQIREISTRAWMRAYTARGMRRVPTYYTDLFEVIGSNPGHVIGSTACLGGLLGDQLLRWRASGFLEQNRYERIQNWLIGLQELFGRDNFYLEMQPSNNLEQVFVNQEIIKLANKLDIPFIITDDAHYLKKEDLKFERIFLNAQGGEREVDSFYATTYLKSDSEVRDFMIPQIGEDNLQRAYQSIDKILDSCEWFSLRKPLKIPCLDWRTFNSTDIESWYGRIPMLKKFWTSPYKEDRELARAIVDSITLHEDLANEEAFNELNLCLEDTWVSSEVNNARWSAYFLNLQKIIDRCWEAGTIVGPGRGSGVGFLLLYALDIIQINSLREQTKTYRFRFLNPDRVSVLDIDQDISGLKRAQVLRYLREQYGEDRVAGVLTLGTEKAKSAILAAARGLGIDVDIARYLSGMVESDRGQQRTLDETFYGDEEKGFLPNKQFRYEMEENYPELWEAAKKIEGLVVRSGIHAGGVIFVDEPFTKSTALMRAPNGDIITQFELKAAEEVSLIKYDLLSVEGIDKIQTCIDLLCEYGYAEKKPTLKETYEAAIGVYKCERNNPEMWDLLCQHKVRALFQMEGQTGIQGIESLKPTSVDDLAVLNSTIRLMAQKKGDEMPTEKCARFKANPELWIRETEQWGLTEKEREVLWPILKTSYGLCITQEQFMLLVQLPELGGFDLAWADKLRKSIAKKAPKDYEKLTKEFYEITAEKGCNERLCRYVWEVLIAMSRGYGFNASHTLAYSIVALQELNLCFRYPIIFWNTANLIVDSGGTGAEEIEEEDGTVREYFGADNASDDDDEEEDGDKKKKKKTQTVNYGKISSAIGQMQAAGVKVSPPDINKSSFTFIPDVDNNAILYGIKGISRIGDELVTQIIKNRPYTSLQDFLSKVKVNVLQALNLIKSGAFDCFDQREVIMEQFIDSIADKKKTLNLRNMQMLIEKDLLPEELDFEKKVFNFNKYLKKSKNDEYGVYVLDDITEPFYRKNFDEDKLWYEEITNGRPALVVGQADWDKVYKKAMDKPRSYIKNHLDELLEKVNAAAVEEKVGKYCDGSISKWEMDSIGFYYHEHELAGVDNEAYDIVDFNSLPEEPEIDRIIHTKDGKDIPLYKLHRFAGTVVDKNKIKGTVSLLTEYGVVTVKIYNAQFAKYDKQISMKMDDGHKKILEKSWLSRGNKLLITGIRRGPCVVPKRYKNSIYQNVIELITEVNEDGSLETLTERMEVE